MRNPAQDSLLLNQDCCGLVVMTFTFFTERGQ